MDRTQQLKTYLIVGALACALIMFVVARQWGVGFLIGLPLVFVGKARWYFYLYAGFTIIFTVSVLVISVLQAIF